MQEVNELSPELLSIAGLNPWVRSTSASRQQMFTSQLSQKLNISGATERYCQTGMEQEMAKYTFAIRMPCNGRILRVIQRYKETMDKESIKANPQTVVIYENLDTHVIGMINIPTYCSYHQHFGFEYAPKAALSQLYPGNEIPEGAVFMDSPAVTAHGGYKYGREMNVAFMSHPAVSEDGIVICRDVLEKLSYKTYETRIVEFGERAFPINLYGTLQDYKAFPEIGEYVRDDGLLMVLRTYNKSLGAVEQSIHDLMEVDEFFDKATYVPGGGRVIDIRVHHDNNTPSPTPVGMITHLEKYKRSRDSFYQEIFDTYKEYRRKLGDNLEITPELSRMVVEAQAALSGHGSQRITKLYKQTPLDDYRLEFVIEYEKIPTIGFKLTDLFGGKGVICHIAEPHEMPVDAAGNRADFIMDGFSTLNRMNPGRVYEQYINAASRDLVVELRARFGIAKDVVKYVKVHAITAEACENNYELWFSCWLRLLDYYKSLSPRMYKFFHDASTDTQLNHLSKILTNGIYLYLPTDNEVDYVSTIEDLMAKFPPVYGPVSYIGYSGVTSVTKDPVLIGSIYMLLLEKTADDWSGVSSARIQHFGVLAPINKHDKYSQPTRNQPVKVIGETEGRIFVAYCEQPMVAEVMDRNNNPSTHRNVVWNLLSSDKPSNIASIVNRTFIPLGSDKPSQIISHVAMCAGWRFKYEAMPTPTYGQTRTL